MKQGAYKFGQMKFPEISPFTDPLNIFFLQLLR